MSKVASKATDGHDLTRVGPGTVLGEMMRQYWIPAAASSELKVDGDPMRLMLLGEQLIAFRDSSGRVGVLDREPLFVCQYRMARGHWQIIKHGPNGAREGGLTTIALGEAPPQVVEVALRAASAIGETALSVIAISLLPVSSAASATRAASTE